MATTQQPPAAPPPAAPPPAAPPPAAPPPAAPPPARATRKPRQSKLATPAQTVAEQVALALTQSTEAQQAVAQALALQTAVMQTQQQAATNAATAQTATTQTIMQALQQGQRPNWVVIIPVGIVLAFIALLVSVMTWRAVPAVPAPSATSSAAPAPAGSTPAPAPPAATAPATKADFDGLKADLSKQEEGRKNAAKRSRDHAKTREKKVDSRMDDIGKELKMARDQMEADRKDANEKFGEMFKFLQKVSVAQTEASADLRQIRSYQEKLSSMQKNIDELDRKLNDTLNKSTAIAWVLQRGGTPAERDLLAELREQRKEIVREREEWKRQFGEFLRHPPQQPIIVPAPAMPWGRPCW